jgi:hypothetical protein
LSGQLAKLAETLNRVLEMTDQAVCEDSIELSSTGAQLREPAADELDSTEFYAQAGLHASSRETLPGEIEHLVGAIDRYNTATVTNHLVEGCEMRPCATSNLNETRARLYSQQVSHIPAMFHVPASTFVTCCVITHVAPVTIERIEVHNWSVWHH